MTDGRSNSEFPPAKLALLNHGLELDGKPLEKAEVSWLNEDQLKFVLREGRNRQIRRMCDLVGLKVLALKPLKEPLPADRLPVRRVARKPLNLVNRTLEKLETNDAESL